MRDVRYEIIRSLTLTGTSNDLSKDEVSINIELMMYSDVGQTDDEMKWFLNKIYEYYIKNKAPMPFDDLVRAAEGNETLMAFVRDVDETTVVRRSGDHFVALVREYMLKETKDRLQSDMTEFWKRIKHTDNLESCAAELENFTKRIEYIRPAMRGEQRLSLNQIQKLSFKEEYDRTDNYYYTGIKTIDDTGPIMSGELILISGYVANLKSTLTHIIVYNMLQQKNRVVIFSLEMSPAIIRNIFYLMHANKKYNADIGLSTIIEKRLTDKQKDCFYAAIDDWAKNVGENLILPAPNPPTAAAMRAYVRRENPDIFVADHPLLMQHTGRYSSDVSAKSEPIRNLKMLALELNILCICPYQISRKAYNEVIAGKRDYNLSDLSWTNEASMTCDRAWSILKKDNFDNTSVYNIEISCLKNRFSKHFNKFETTLDADKRIISKEHISSKHSLQEDVMKLLEESL